LVAFSSVNVVARAFYALGDTGTPMKISLVCLTVNLILAILLVVPFRAAGLGLANSLTSFINLGLLLYALRRKLGRLDFSELRTGLAALVGAAALAGLGAWSVSQVWREEVGHGTLVTKVGAVFAPMAVAGMLYWGASLWAKVPVARELLTLVRRGRRAC
jgi:putative peptidoglycan lipid II flippase